MTNAASQLPDGCVTPVVKDDFGDVYGMFYAMTTDGIADEEMVEYANLVKRELQDIPGVRRVDIYGDRKPCINIDIIQDKMANLGVHPAEILATLNNQNKTVYSGYFKTGKSRLRIGVDDSYESIRDIENLLIQGHENDQLRLRDVASVTRGYQDPSRNEMRYDTVRALGISISMEKGGNIVTLGEGIFPTRSGEGGYRYFYDQSGGVGAGGDSGIDADDGIPERCDYRYRSGHYRFGGFRDSIFTRWNFTAGFPGGFDRCDGDAGG